MSRGMVKSVNALVVALVATLLCLQNASCQQNNYTQAEYYQALSQEFEYAPNADNTDAVLSQVANPPIALSNLAQWANYTETAEFSSNSGNGTNYQACENGSIAVGLRCKDETCSNLSLFCSADNFVTNFWDTSNVPALGDNAAIANRTKVVSYIAPSGYGRACPTNGLIQGLSCAGDSCKYMGIFCASAPASITVALPNPDRWDYYTDSNRPGLCTWEDNTSSTRQGDVSNPALCPKNKYLAGLKSTGPNGNSVQVYCCPILSLPTTIAQAQVQSALFSF